MSVSRKKILFLSSWYPSDAHPTLGNFVQRHAEAIATLHEVHVVYLTPLKGETSAHRVVQFTEKGVQHTIVYFPKKGLKALRRWKAFNYVLRLLKDQGNDHFDLVHQNVLWSEGWQAVVYKKRTRTPFIVTEHWTGYQKNRPHPLPKKVLMLSRWVARHASVLCPVTEHLKDDLIHHGIKGHFEVVPNVVDTALFSLKEKTSQTIKFLHVSSLVDEHKNITGILKVWKNFSDAHPNVHLEIGGDGPFELFAQKALQLGIRPESIHFFGTLPWEGIAAKMQEAHALVLFSNYENLPCVIVESMASGMAVISSNVGGIAEHIQPTNGILVEKGNEVQLLDALQQFVATHHQFDPISIRTYAENNFSLPAVAASFDRVYTRAINNK
ncbi:MAG: glycosyltransferase [Flavobacteriales bacterium]